MAALQRFSFHSKSTFNFYRPFVSNLHVHCLSVKKKIILTENPALQLSNFPNLDTPQRKFHLQNVLSDQYETEVLNDTSEIEASQDLKIRKTEQNNRSNFQLESILKSLEEFPLSREKAIKICWKLHKTFRKNFGSHIKFKQLLKGDKIQYLMIVLEKYLHTMDPYEVLAVFEFYCFSQIPITEIFKDKILVMIMKNINNYSAIDVLFIYHNAVELKDDTKYVKSLKFVCQTYMQHIFMDKLQINQEIGMLPFFFQQRTLPLSFRIELKNLINKCNLKAFSSIQMMYIMNGIKFCSQKSHIDSVFNEKVKKALKKLMFTSNSPQVFFKLAQLYIMGVYKKLYEYDEEMCDLFASSSMLTQQRLKNVFKIMEYLCRIGHLNNILSNFVFEKLESWDSKDKNSTTLLKIFARTGLSQLDKDTQHFIIKELEMLDFSDILNPKIGIMSLDSCLEMNLGLAIMGIYNKKMIDKCFDLITQNFDKLNTSGLFTLWSILLLNQWVSALHPSYENELRKNVIDDCCNLFLKKMDSAYLEQVITDIFGKNYVLTIEESPLKNIPSCSVVLEGENKPMDLSSFRANNVPINLKTIPENSRIVFIQEVSNEISWEFKNVSQLQGHSQLYKYILKSLGFDVITLEKSQFHNILEAESRKTFLISEFEKNFGKANLML